MERKTHKNIIIISKEIIGYEKYDEGLNPYSNILIVLILCIELFHACMASHPKNIWLYSIPYAQILLYDHKELNGLDYAQNYCCISYNYPSISP